MKDLLKKGNRSVFARMLCEKYPEAASENGWKASNYQSWVDFNEVDKIFVAWLPNGDKDFFDCELNYLGRKEY